MFKTKCLKANFLFSLLLANIFILTSLSFAQPSTINRQDEVHRRFDYRRQELNDLPPIGKYAQPKEQVFPLGYGTYNLNKITNGTGVWTELNPKVPRVTYLGLHFVNKDTGWACGQSGAVIKTTNGGDDWTISETPVNNLLLKTHSYNGQIVLVTGYDGIILRSSNEGETFEQVTSGVGTGYDLWGVQMLNDTLGWVCGLYQTLLKTTDAGLNWQPLNTGLNQHYWAVDFINEQYGMISCSEGKILKTTNGGNNWSQTQAGDTRDLFTIDIIDSLHIAAAGYDGKNVYSSDGGTTWVSNPDLPAFSATNCIDFINADTGYTVQDVYDIRKTTNRGQSWFSTAPNVTSEWYIQLLDDGTGYSCGDDLGDALSFYKRTDGLENWSRLFLNDDFADVFFINEEKGFVISGITSVIQALYKTEDGGLTWTNVPGAPGGNDLLFLDSLTGFIGGDLIYKTLNGGETWYATQGSDGAGRIFFTNETTGWAVHSGIIYKTANGGENWFEQFTDILASFRSVFFIDSLKGWVISPGYGGIYNTTDGGTNWIQRLDIQVYDGNDIYFDDSTGFIINFLNLEKTTNAGNIWFTQFNSQYVIRNFGWLSKSNGFIVGDGVYETIDSGDSWNEILELRNVGLRNLQAPLTYLGYATGYKGLIYKYIDTSYIPVELISFGGSVGNNELVLFWITASELNNQGFYIQKTKDCINWETIGFVTGRGNSTEMNSYRFVDRIMTNLKMYYRLKQVDYDGSFEYSNTIEVYINSPSEFSLSQNYPNPFNNSTVITYQIPTDEFITLNIYDVLGNNIKTLIEENKKAGYYTINYSANDLSSGIYFYRLTAGNYSSTKKFILLK